MVRDANSHADIAASARRTPTSTSSRIDPADDAEETAARAPRAARRRVRAGGASRPRDDRAERSALPAQQWNLPLINIERAWDIQPQAGSSITVAVIDTGMAYTNATLTATLAAFKDSTAGSIRRSAR